MESVNPVPTPSRPHPGIVSVPYNTPTHPKGRDRRTIGPPVTSVSTEGVWTLLLSLSDR